jgi:hypothetical protein
MNGYAFRSPEDWKSALLILPDNAYFELMRSVFGNIKTPFNKQRLVDDLESFLSKKDIQEAIAAYIDERDAKLIAAIALLGEPVPEELETFFAGEFSSVELPGILLNLEERLILYRFQDRGAARESEAPGSIRRLALNPLLEPALRPVIGNSGVLFPSLPLSEANGNAALNSKTIVNSESPGGIGDDRVLAAFFAFVAAESEFFKTEGGIRKKVLDEGRLLFDGLDLEALAGGLQALGLLRQSAAGFAGGLVRDESKLRSFAGLPRGEMRGYLAAGICVARGASLLSPYNRSRVQSLARFIGAFMGTLQPGRRYPRTTLVRLAFLLERSGPGERGDGFFAWDPEGARLNAADGFDSILAALEIAGLLRVLPGGAAVCGVPPPNGSGAAERAIAMDTAFSCLLYPEISFADALSLAAFSMVRETGAAVRFELTRESVVRGFDQGMDADCMIALLDRLSGNQVEQNLRWTLKDWETRYAGVSLLQGLVLTLAEDRRYLAEAEPVASLVSRTLAPGVYLLAAEDRAGVVHALRREGIDIVAQPLPGVRHGVRPSPYPPLEPPGRGNAPDSGAAPAESPPPDPLRAERYKERFRGALGKLSLARDEREELAARIERRLILSESQLAAVPARYEKLEARGLDYVGKTSIAKQAIASKQLIEIVWSGQRGEENRAVGLPNALQKSGGETLLVLKPVPSGDPISLPLAKIGLLRRVKSSLFGE